jgi:hypothetical protein
MTYIIIILFILLVYLILINCKSESFNNKNFDDKLNYRITHVKYPFDKIVPLRPINVKEYDCELCVFGDKYKFYDYGDYITKPKNKSCPPNSVYMNSRVYVQD